MATFDIQYSERLPSGRAGQVPMNINVDTGAGMLGNAIAQLGENLVRIGEKHQQANNALEYSSMKRRYDELGSAAFTSLQNVSDDKEAQEIIEKYRLDMESIQSDNNEVNRKFQIHVNNTITGEMDAFSNLIERNKVRKLNDEFEVNYQDMLEKGDYDGADELLGNLQAAGAITQVKADARRKTFFIDSMLAQSNKLVNLGDSASLQRAESILTTLPKLKTADGKPVEISGQQLEQKTRLLNAARQQLKQSSDTAEIEIITAMGENKEASLADRMAAGQQFIQKLQQTDISGPRYEDLYATINKWMDGDEGDTDWNIYKELFDMTIPVRNKQESAGAVWEKLIENRKNLSTSEFKSLKEEIEQAVKYNPPDTTGPYISTAISTVKSFTDKVADTTDPDTVLDIQKRLNAIYKSADKTPEQIEKLTEKLLLPYKEKEAKGRLERLWGITPIGIVAKRIQILKLSREVKALTNEPETIGEYESQLESYLLQNNRDAAIRYESRWRSKFE